MTFQEFAILFMSICQLILSLCVLYCAYSSIQLSKRIKRAKKDSNTFEVKK